MGRQIAVLLALQDERELLEIAHSRDFILVPEDQAGPGLLKHQLQEIPDDAAADEADYGCYLIPRQLAAGRRALKINRSPSRPYAIDETELPAIEWLRTSGRVRAGFRYDSRLRNRIYLATGWDYGRDEAWLRPAEDLYDLLTRRIKKVTVKVQDGWPRYVSKRFGPEFFDVPGLVREGGGWVMHRSSAEESA